MKSIALTIFFAVGIYVALKRPELKSVSHRETVNDTIAVQRMRHNRDKDNFAGKVSKVVETQYGVIETLN